MRRSIQILAALALLAAAGPLLAGALLIPLPTSEWDISEWINQDPGHLEKLKGKVVVIEFFQLWCPGCNNFSLPLMQQWEQKYGDRDDFIIVSIHSVFEGHEYQTPERLREFVEQLGITRPVGIDSFDRGALIPSTMESYQIQGTPQVVLVDKGGYRRFSHFGYFDVAPVEYLLERMLDERWESGHVTSDRSSKSKSKASSTSTSKPTGRTGSTRQTSGRRDRRGTPRGGPAAAGRDDSGENGSGEDDDPQADAALSGVYQVTLQQTSKTCGEVIPAKEFTATLEVRPASIEISIGERYLGKSKITATYNENDFRFQSTSNDSASDAEHKVELRLQLSGQFTRTEETPELEFEFTLVERGDDRSRNCRIQGKGRGRKTG